MKMTTHWMISIITACAAVAFIVTTSQAADTSSSTDDTYTDHMMPGMPGGMGPGYMRGGMGYGGMGPGYMYQGGRGYDMGMMGGMMGGGYGMGMMHALNLDKAQRSKLRALMREQRQTNCKTMTEMMDVRDELAAEYDKDKPNPKTIGKLYEKMQGMQRQMVERMVETHNKMRGMLNKEQKENYDNMHHNGMGMME